MITPSPSSKIESNALVLHQSEEGNLRRHIRKILGSTESFLFHPSAKRNVLIRHIVKIASILFAVVELLALATNRCWVGSIRSIFHRGVYNCKRARVQREASRFELLK